MKKLIVAGLAAGLLAAVPISAFAGQTIDATHLDLNGNGCTQCHFSMDINTGLEIVPGNTCGGCHINETGGYNDNSAPYAASHKGFTCQTCHNPHVSLEYGEGTTALVSGTITSGDNATANLVLTYDSVAISGGWSADPTLWAAKTKTDRGLILWETVGADNYSFKVSAADNTTITVEGGVPAGLTLADMSGSFELHYGQLIATAVDGTTATYRDANATTAIVDFPSMGTTGTTAGNMFVNEGGNGICQRCHTTTSHWQNSASNDGHNVGQDCTDCHKHDNKVGPTYGFGIDVGECVNCHTGYPEPPASGAHAVHASSTVGYAMACATCHKGGMNDQMGYIPSDGTVQIGINLIGRNDFSGLHTNYDGVTGTIADPQGYGSGYEGKNDGTVTTGGTTTCSNIYCHSTGQASELGCLTGEIQGKTVTSPRWDLTDTIPGDPDGDGDKCNNCHGQIYTTLGINKHEFHVGVALLACANCHADTAANDGTIANKMNHVNGSVEIKQGGMFDGFDLTNYALYPAFTFDPGTKNCSSVPCHGPKTWVDEPATCVVDAANAATVVTPNVDPVAQATCYNVTANSFIFEDSSTDDDNIDPVKNAAFGGHMAANPAYLKLNWQGLTGSIFDGADVGYAPQTFLADMYAFDDATLASLGNTVAVKYILIDNDGLSVSNEASKTPGGWVNFGWINCDYGAYGNTTNDVPIMSYTSSAVNATTIQVIDHSVDLDWDTTPSNPAWTGIDKNAANGCGNDGSTAQLKLKWYDSVASGTVTKVDVILKDTPQDSVITHSFDPTYVAGGKAWWSYQIKDNSYLSCGTGWWVKSGWVQQAL